MPSPTAEEPTTKIEDIENPKQQENFEAAKASESDKDSALDSDENGKNANGDPEKLKEPSVTETNSSIGP